MSWVCKQDQRAKDEIDGEGTLWQSDCLGQESWAMAAKSASKIAIFGATTTDTYY